MHLCARSFLLHFLLSRSAAALHAECTKCICALAVFFFTFFAQGVQLRYMLPLMIDSSVFTVLLLSVLLFSMLANGQVPGLHRQSSHLLFQDLQSPSPFSAAFSAVLLRMVADRQTICSCECSACFRLCKFHSLSLLFIAFSVSFDSHVH